MLLPDYQKCEDTRMFIRFNTLPALASRQTDRQRNGQNW